MFDRLKKKFWGEEVFSVPIVSSKKASVYVWNKDGNLTLNIKSEDFSYVQSPGRNDGTVTFQAGEIDNLLQAIHSAHSKIQQSWKEAD